MTHPLALVGNTGSPYSRKMRAVLRYRQIPFRWLPKGSRWHTGIPAVKVPIIPVLAFPDGSGAYVEAMTDSSPQIMVLEERFYGRSIVPADPVVACLDHLIEDYAGEWVTKAMYHYRWHPPEARDKAGKLLPLQAGINLADDDWTRMRDWITNRRVDRLSLVGSTPSTVPVIEASYRRLLEILDAHLRTSEFVLGGRPSRCDFGLFGQLSQLTWFDTEGVDVAVEVSPRTVTWVERADDLSWFEPDDSEPWFTRDDVSPSLTALLGEIGRTYAPFMIANHRAFETDSDVVRYEVDGVTCEQGPFAYQRKCLDWLRDIYHGMEAGDRAAVDDILAGTGCEALFVD